MDFIEIYVDLTALSVVRIGRDMDGSGRVYI
jgi:hypothetical protein